MHFIVHANTTDTLPQCARQSFNKIVHFVVLIFILKDFEHLIFLLFLYNHELLIL